MPNKTVVLTCKDCLSYETCPKVTEMIIEQFGSDNHVSELCVDFKLRNQLTTLIENYFST